MLDIASVGAGTTPAPGDGVARAATGLCFETRVFDPDPDPAELLGAIGQYAPVGLAFAVETRQ